MEVAVGFCSEAPSFFLDPGLGIYSVMDVLLFFENLRREMGVGFYYLPRLIFADVRTLA